MSHGFTYLKGNCPICLGKRNDCRQSNESELIFCHEEGANPSGYTYQGTDSWGFGIWQSQEKARDFASKSQTERKQEAQRRQQQQKQKKELQIAGELSPEERDKYYRQILAQLPLLDVDKNDLKTRGLSDEQIEAKGYKSVSQWHKVKGEFPSNLPGLLPGNILNSQPGYLCPIWWNGLLIGFQGRKRNVKDRDNRYYWLSSRTKKNPSGVSAYLRGELPITESEPLTLKNHAIWACEGTGAKPDITRHRLGVRVLGAASGAFYKSPILTKESLDRFAKEQQTKQIIIPPDKGDIFNKNVLLRHKKNVEFFLEIGWDILFAWWAKPQRKGIKISMN